MGLLEQKVSRRTFMLGSVAAGSGVAALWGSWPWLPGLFHRVGVYAYPMRTELWKNVEVRYSVCRQCRSDCGIEARVFNGVLTKLDGNPYHPNTTEPHLTYSTPVEESLKFREAHSLCARGQAGRQSLYDRNRVFFPLKRVGSRGSNKWKTISWSQLIEEVTNGGHLFKDVAGEESRYVEGFKDLWKEGRGPNTPVDPQHPDLGPVTNQFSLFWGRAEPGQSTFLTRFADAFGSVNAIPHVSICELSHHVATRQSLDGKTNMVKPDIINADFIIWFGTDVFQANFPMQTLSRKVALASSKGGNPANLQFINRGDLKFVLVDARAPNGAARAEQFVKVKPGGDSGIVMGMIRHILENQLYNAPFLSYPSHAAAKRRGEVDFTNATWLVVEDPKHPLHRKFLTAEAAGLARGSSRSAATPVVIDAASGRPALAERSPEGSLWPSGALSFAPIRVNGIACRTGFQWLWEEARSKSSAEYAQIAGVPEPTIIDLAKEFTSHGRRAVADFYRGPVKHTNGFYTGRGIMTLNFLVGNMDWVGGTATGGAPADFMGGYKGAPYNLNAWPAPKYRVPPGVAISREGSFYENTSMYKEAVAQGKSPFPAPRPWYPFGFGIWQELFAGAWYQYPYPVKILMMHEANPLWSAPPGMSGYPDENLPLFRLIKDLKKLPLFIASDILISETSSYADYIVPDTGYLEAWGALPGWPTYTMSAIGVRQPVIEPLTAKTPGGEPMSVEQFLIDVAKKLDMPGFGKHAFMEGGALDTREDYYLKMVANIAYYPSYLKRRGATLVKTGSVPDASTDLEEKAVARWKPRYGRALTEAQWRKAAYVLARGGRFEDYDVGYVPATPVPKVMTHRYGQEKLPCQIYNPIVGTTHNAITGELFSPVAKHEDIRFHDGTLYDSVDHVKDYPFTLITYKQPIHSKSRTWADKWLVELMPESYAEINPMDARRLGVKDGDWVLVRSATYPQGLKAPVQIMPGVRPGVVAFPAAFGRWHYNSGEWAINGTTYRGDRHLNTYTRLNAVMRLDPSLTDKAGWGTCMEDPVGGSASYYDTRVQVERTAPPADRFLKAPKVSI